MADSKISALSAITSLATTDELAVASSGASKKITGANLAASLPGFEIGYTQITGAVNVASTTEATGTTIISPGALTFDGGPVMVEFFAPFVDVPTNAAGAQVVVNLFEGATNLGRIANATTFATTAAQDNSLSGRFRFTPTAAAHTYVVTAFASNTTGTPAIVGGAGGTAAWVPAFVRFTKV